MDAYDEFNDLLNICLTDGVITDKEQEALYRKAASLGIDLEEAKFLINAAQQKFDKRIYELASRQRVASCPFCGNPIPKKTETCPHCQKSITHEAKVQLKELFVELEGVHDLIQTGRYTSRAKRKSEKYICKAQLYYGDNPKMQKLLNEIVDQPVSPRRGFKEFIKSLW